MQYVMTDNSRKNPGHYSPGIIHNGLLYVSGQLSVDPDNGRRVEGGIVAETRQALRNMERVLKAAGVSRQDVLLCRVYTPDVALWDTINKEYALFFGEHRPARVVVPTSMLHHGCLVEIEAVAAMPEKE